MLEPRNKKKKEGTGKSALKLSALLQGEVCERDVTDIFNGTKNLNIKRSTNVIY